MSTQYIVQERFKDYWWQDDPDQPDDSTNGFDEAKRWMENEYIREDLCHLMYYRHRIIERTETQVWPNSAIPGADTFNFPVDTFSSATNTFRSDQPHGV